MPKVHGEEEAHFFKKTSTLQENLAYEGNEGGNMANNSPKKKKLHLFKWCSIRLNLIYKLLFLTYRTNHILDKQKIHFEVSTKDLHPSSFPKNNTSRY